MQVPIPPETRREFDWIAGLSGTGLLVAASGLTVAAMLWEARGLPVAVRGPGAVLILVITAALAWLKWPMEDHGVRLTTWAARMWTYYSQYRAPVKALSAQRSRFGPPADPKKGATRHAQP